MPLGMKPENFQSGLTGRHRERSGAEAIRYPNRWGDTFAERATQFLDWRYIAMQVIQRDGGSYRLVAIFDTVFDYIEGACFATNEKFAQEAGHCTVKTVSRELKALREMGLIKSDPTWLEKQGKMVKGRRITLMIPIDMTGIQTR